MKKYFAGIAAATLVLGLAGASAAVADDPSKDVDTGAKLLATTVAGENTIRIGGTDRYGTAVAVSEATWTEESAALVFIATGETYPDALSIAASTDGLGPILLVRRDVLPAVTRTEIQRLHPCGIVIAGGPAAVSDVVALELDGLADPSRCAAE